MGRSSQAALSITNGAQSWDSTTYSALQTIMTNGSGLTAPTGTGYYFAGFFSGLEADGTYITEENGYYVLDGGSVGSGVTKTFANVTELRPRYDDMPETGAYQALWIKNGFTGQIMYATMRVLPAESEIAVTVYANSDDTILAGNGTTLL